MNNWIRQHAGAAKSAFKQIASAPGNFLFNVVVVAVALSLPIAGLTLVENIRPVSDQLAIAPELSLFLKTDVNRTSATALADNIRQLLKNSGAQAKIAFIPKETALANLQAASAMGDVLATLGENPLPDAYVLTFSQHFDLSKRNAGSGPIDALASALQKLPEVDHVQIDSNWIKRLAALMNLAQFSLIALAIILSVVVITVIFNATRLQVLSHRAEINVIRLLGATHQYICRPYYYTGAVLGAIAGLVSLAIVAVALIPMNQAISEIANLYGSNFQLQPLNPDWSAYLVGSSALLGLFGAYLSVRHQASKKTSKS